VACKFGDYRSFRLSHPLTLGVYVRVRTGARADSRVSWNLHNFRLPTRDLAERGLPPPFPASQERECFRYFALPNSPRRKRRSRIAPIIEPSSPFARSRVCFPNYFEIWTNSDPYAIASAIEYDRFSDRSFSDLLPFFIIDNIEISVDPEPSCRYAVFRF